MLSDFKSIFHTLPVVLETCSLGSRGKAPVGVQGTWDISVFEAGKLMFSSLDVSTE